MGTKIIAAKKEAEIVNRRRNPNWPKKIPTTPFTRNKGMKMTRVVRVEAPIARPTSEAPVIAPCS